MANEKKYSVENIPDWLIRKNCKNALVSGACNLAISDGTCSFIRETEKAMLFEWQNTTSLCACSGGQFWVAKSLL